MHAQVRRVLRQAWELDDAGKAETLLRNLARRLEKDWEGVSASILEGLGRIMVRNIIFSHTVGLLVIAILTVIIAQRFHLPYTVVAA
jgi:hypothetical protein